MIDVEAIGFENVLEKGKEIVDTTKARFGTYLEKIALTAVAEAKSNLQNNMNINTGTLLSSIDILENNAGSDILIGTREPYAAYIEYGRGPVRPVSAKVLHWKDKNGKDVFATYAGPTNPKPFLEPAVISAAKRFAQISVQYESDYLRSLGLI